MVLWDGEEPFHESAHSSVCVDSELGDPQYDQSLLENLFYNAPVSGLFIISYFIPVNASLFDFLPQRIFEILYLLFSDIGYQGK